MVRIQIIVIIINLIFLGYIAKLIKRGKLREEYAIVWIVCTIILITLSFWRRGLDILAKLFGVYEPANLVFTAFIFVILIYLLLRCCFCAILCYSLLFVALFFLTSSKAERAFT